MNKIDWGKIKFRASSWGNLLTESQSKADRDAGRLGATCQKELIKIYTLMKYDRKKEIITRAMEKGIVCEDDSIMLYSKVEGVLYSKNEEPLENDYFTGHPDLYLGENIYNADCVDDIKSSYELDSFIPKMIEGADKGYEAQLNVYYDLCNAPIGNLVYCLVNAPDSVLFQEHEWLLRNGQYISAESPDFIKAWAEKEKMLVFDDIDYRERVIKIPVPRNDELIEKMKAKVPIFRQWLEDFEKKHLNLYPKALAE